jgi:hypothetical protein
MGEAWTCSTDLLKDMQHGHAGTYRIDMQKHAGDMEQGPAACTRSMQTQHGNEVRNGAQKFRMG